MKKFVFLLGILFAMQMVVRAQVTEQTVTFNAHLISTFNLNMLDGGTQDITFNTALDYNTGVTGPLGLNPGITTGTTHITVEATEDWHLTITAQDNFVGYAGPNGAGTGTIPVDNVGVWCEATGLYTFGDQLTCTFLDPLSIRGLEVLVDITLIGIGGSGNAGDISDNAFTLNWEMGTMQNASMHTTSMFDQMANGDFSTGDFTADAILTLVPGP